LKRAETVLSGLFTPIDICPPPPPPPPPPAQHHTPFRSFCSENETIVHLDLKPDNVMSTPAGVLKIADFGLAQTLKGKAGLVTDGMYRGTEEYMAPEVNASQSAYGCPADIWSLGMMFYELVFGGLIKVRTPPPTHLAPRSGSD